MRCTSAPASICGSTIPKHLSHLLLRPMLSGPGNSSQAYRNFSKMRKQVNIVVTCTKRKRSPLAPGLRMGEVQATDIGTGFAAWIERLSTSEAETVLARNLYAGEHWSIVRSLEDVAASSGLEATVWICSAGYGLI